jgi:hypothetical protein
MNLCKILKESNRYMKNNKEKLIQNTLKTLTKQLNTIFLKKIKNFGEEIEEENFLYDF